MNERTLRHASIASTLSIVAFACSPKAPDRAPGTSASPEESAAIVEVPRTASATAPETAPTSTSDVPPTPSTTTAPVPQPGLPPIAQRFLPLEDTCKVDADCAVTDLGVDERFFCCDGCSVATGTKAWVARANRACEAYRKEKSQHVCPPRDCEAAGRPVCRAGRCKLT